MSSEGTVFEQTLLPVFFVLGAGYYAGWRGRIADSRHPEALIVILMQFALPCSLLLGVGSAPPAMLRLQLPLLLVLLLAMLIIYGIAFAVTHRWSRRPVGEAAVQALTVSFANNVAIGLPFLIHVNGPQGQLAVIAGIVAGALVLSPLTLVLLECFAQEATPEQPMSHRVGKALRVSLRRPVILAPALGLLFPLTGHLLPAVAVSALDVAAKATIGIALFLTGLILSAQPVVLSRSVAIGVLLKNIGQPLLLLLLLRPFHLHGMVAREAFLLACVPAGFFGTVFGARYRVPSQEAGSTLVWSTMLCIVTLPLAIMVAARIA